MPVLCTGAGGRDPCKLNRGVPTKVLFIKLSLILSWHTDTNVQFGTIGTKHSYGVMFFVSGITVWVL